MAAQEISFRAGFDRDLYENSLYEKLEDFLGTPVKVAKGELFAREIQAGYPLSDDDADLRYRLSNGKSLNDIAGESITIGKTQDGNGKNLIALIDGWLVADGDLLLVTPKPDIFVDLTPEHGSLEYDTNVRVFGSVLEGSKISVRGGLEITGLVEGAELKAGGSIVMRGGMAGGSVGSATAGGDILATFVQQATLSSYGSIAVSGMVLGSDLSASKKIRIAGKRSSLVGGITRAREEIMTPIVGSQAATSTVIELGRDPFASKRNNELKNRLREIERDLLEKKKEALYSSGHLTGIIKTPHPKDHFTDLFLISEKIKEGLFDSLTEEQKKSCIEFGSALMESICLEEEKNSIMDEGLFKATSPYPAASLKVAQVAHPGVKISIVDTAITLDMEYDRPKFIICEDQIEAVAW